MAEPDIDAFSYGVLALSNPNDWANEPECDEFSHLVTGKSVYVWPLVFATYVQSLQKRKGLTFEKELSRLDEYIGRHFEEFKDENPVDFSNAGSQYVKSKSGSFQSIRKNFGAPAKRLKIPDAERMLSVTLRDLEERRLIVDPFTVTTAGLTMAILGAVPFSFTKRTGEGDAKYLQVKAMLWEFEQLTEGEKREIRFHFFMEKAIEHLKKHLKLLVQEEPEE